MTDTNRAVDILIVDDDVPTGDMLKTILSRKYPQTVVHSAYEPGSALDGFRENLPDILITDFLMPDLNGIQMARKFREIKPETKVIVLSGFSDPNAFKDDAEDDSVIDFRIVKPVNFGELFAVLDRCLVELGASG